MLRRTEGAAQAGPLDHRDLRGWHYALTGGYLAVLSPYGFDSSMTGRYAYLGDTVELSPARPRPACTRPAHHRARAPVRLPAARPERPHSRPRRRADTGTARRAVRPAANGHPCRRVRHQRGRTGRGGHPAAAPGRADPLRARDLLDEPAGRDRGREHVPGPDRRRALGRDHADGRQRCGAVPSRRPPGTRHRSRDHAGGRHSRHAATARHRRTATRCSAHSSPLPPRAGPRRPGTVSTPSDRSRAHGSPEVRRAGAGRGCTPVPGNVSRTSGRR